MKRRCHKNLYKAQMKIVMRERVNNYIREQMEKFMNQYVMGTMDICEPDSQNSPWTL